MPSSFIKIVRKIIRRTRRFLAKEEILVLGDSHVDVFNSWWFVLKFPKKYFRVVSVGGATASGLENPNSKTQAYKIFREALAERNYSRVIISLGEVDTGFIIWYRAKKYNVDVLEMLIQSVDKYTNFLSEAKGYEELIVISTALPSIKDDNSWGEVANLRREVQTTQKQRTEMTLLFNSKVRKYCEDNGILFIDLDKECLGDNGLLRDELRNKNLCDHHYDPSRYAKLLSKELSGIM